VVSVKVRAHVLISGRVQGVFFRSEIKLRARRLDVTGWVRNLDDSRVEAVFEGNEINVTQLVDFCKKGPSGARVANARVAWEAYTGEFRSFEIENGLDY
jgi:acylphosphatase